MLKKIRGGAWGIGCILLVIVLTLLPVYPTMAATRKKCFLNREKVTLYEGKSFRLKVYGTKKKIQWKTSKKEIANVSQKGKVVAKKAGRVKIIAKVTGKKLVCRVTVKRRKNSEDLMLTYTSGKPMTPVLSSVSGVYETEFQLKVAHQLGTKVYYTTDGSIPTEESILYTDGIEIENRNDFPNVLSAAKNIKKMCVAGSGYDYVPKNDEVEKCTVIRAVAVGPNHEMSDIVTGSYFVGNQVKMKYAGAALISMVVDPDSLLNDETGIYVLGKKYEEWKNTDEGREIHDTNQYWRYVANYSQKKWEREAVIDFIDTNSEKLEFSVPVGIRIQGGASRMYGQKSFSIYLRDKYGMKNLKYPLIPGDVDENGEQIKKYKSFILRNGGNDTVCTKIRDVFNQGQVSDRSFGVQAARPCIMFINGEYWGLYNLTEKYSDNSLEENYGVDKNNVVIFKKGELDEGQEDDKIFYEELMDFADRDFTNESVYEHFCQIMDIDSFTDYYATEIYIDNFDWSPRSNYQLWRVRRIDDTKTNPYADGKWRYLLFDTESSTGSYYDDFNRAGEKSFANTLKNDPLFAAVMKNTTFQKKFLKTIKEIGSLNFKYETCIDKLDEYASIYRPLMQDFYARFYGKDTITMRINRFDNNIRNIKTFMHDRYFYIVNEIETWCELQTR